MSLGNHEREKRERAKGRLGGGNRGDGGGFQRAVDKGWEGRRAGMRKEGNKVNGNC